MKERLEYVDAAKVFAIIMVILGHCDATPLTWKCWIYGVHMPLFFVVSGFFIKPLGLWQALKKYAKAYLFPYTTMCLLLLLTRSVALSAQVGGVKTLPLNDELIRFLWASSSFPGIPFGDVLHVGPLWFLVALFVGSTFLSLAMRKLDSLGVGIVVLIGVVVAICSVKRIILPIALHTGMLATMYIYAGHLMRRYKIAETYMSKPLWMRLFVLLFYLGATMTIGGVDLYKVNMGYSICGLILSFLGVLSLLSLSNYCRVSWLSFLGRHTLEVFSGHVFFKCIIGAFYLDLSSLSSLGWLYAPMVIGIEISGAFILGYLLSKCHILKLR